MLHFFENYKTVKVDVQYLCIYKLNIYSSRANTYVEDVFESTWNKSEQIPRASICGKEINIYI